MASGFIGLNEQLLRDSVQTPLRTAKNDIATIRMVVLSAVSSGIGPNMAWHGDDAMEFERCWQNEADPRLEQVIEMLGKAVADIERAIGEQQNASAPGNANFL